jgi:hypothetical protein
VSLCQSGASPSPGRVEGVQQRLYHSTAGSCSPQGCADGAVYTSLYIGPRAKKSMNAVTDVATPTMVLTPLRISSMYPPGYIGVTGTGTPPSYPFPPVDRLRGCLPPNEDLNRHGFVHASCIGNSCTASASHPARPQHCCPSAGGARPIAWPYHYRPCRSGWRRRRWR